MVQHGACNANPSGFCGSTPVRFGKADNAPEGVGRCRKLTSLSPCGWWPSPPERDRERGCWSPSCQSRAPKNGYARIICHWRILCFWLIQAENNRPKWKILLRLSLEAQPPYTRRAPKFVSNAFLASHECIPPTTSTNEDIEG